MVANQGLTSENSSLKNDVDLAKVSEVGHGVALRRHQSGTAPALLGLLGVSNVRRS